MSKTELEQNKNEDELKLLLSQVNHRLEKIYLGGGEKKIAKLHKKGKMTARERVSYLIDENSTFLEVGAFAGYEMYQEYGGCPGGGVLTGIGYVSGRQCMIIANDATVKAGAWFPITGKKNLRAQEIAMENRLPLIYLVDSAGVFLPMQDETRLKESEKFALLTKMCELESQQKPKMVLNSNWELKRKEISIRRLCLAMWIRECGSTRKRSLVRWLLS